MKTLELRRETDGTSHQVVGVGHARVHVVRSHGETTIVSFADPGYQPAAFRLLRRLVKRLYDKVDTIYFVEWRYGGGSWYTYATRYMDIALSDFDRHVSEGDTCHVEAWDRKSGGWTLAASSEDRYHLTCNEPDPVLSDHE